MNKLFDAKFTKFEQSFKDTIIEEVKLITDPMKNEVKDLKAENKKLRTEVTMFITFI